MKRLALLLVLLQCGGLVAGCGDDGVPKDNSKIQEPPPPPPPSGPTGK